MKQVKPLPVVNRSLYNTFIDFIRIMSLYDKNVIAQEFSKFDKDTQDGIFALIQILKNNIQEAM